MTTISVPGKITALEVDESGGFKIVALVGGPQASPTIILPSGERHTIILSTGAPDSTGALTQTWFRLDASFSIGDIVEIYSVGQFGPTVFDENGTQVFGGGDGHARKILTGAPTYTDNNGIAHPLAIWRSA
jgi:hypothetical protein